MAEELKMAPEVDYFHLTNLESPLDKVDRNFLDVLEDYKIGPPVGTIQRDAASMQKEGIFGVYTTSEALTQVSVIKLTGFSLSALSQVKLA